eukprot:968835-Rhodomonas_salina.2
MPWPVLTQRVALPGALCSAPLPQCPIWRPSDGADSDLSRAGYTPLLSPYASAMPCLVPHTEHAAAATRSQPPPSTPPISHPISQGPTCRSPACRWSIASGLRPDSRFQSLRE